MQKIINANYPLALDDFCEALACTKVHARVRALCYLNMNCC